MIYAALAIYLRSPAAFESIRDMHILQLPSKRSLQDYVSANLLRPGINHDYMARQYHMYSKHSEDVSVKSDCPPVGEGILIFDEVKVQTKVMWNSKNNEIVGLAVSEDDLRSLHDVYASVKDEKGLQMTSHILQFLWRDLSSNFDVIGPYFTSDSMMEAKFITSCVLDAMLAFESFRFGVRGLVCNGSSCNLSFMKGALWSVGTVFELYRR